MDDIDQLNEQNDIDLSNVNTDYPVLPKGAYEFIVSDVKIVAGKSREGTQVLEIKLALDQQAKALHTGREVNPGFPLTTRIGLSQTEKYTQAMINENLARFMEATLGRKGRLQPLTQFVGAKCKVNLNVKDDPQYGERNEVGRFLKKA